MKNQINRKTFKRDFLNENIIIIGGGVADNNIRGTRLRFLN